LRNITLIIFSFFLDCSDKLYELCEHVEVPMYNDSSLVWKWKF